MRKPFLMIAVALTLFGMAAIAMARHSYHPHKVNAGAMAAADHLRAAPPVSIHSQTVRDPASVQK
jgi:hypothetical protein